MKCELDLFRKLIKEKYQDNQEEIIKTLNSLDARIMFAEYHFYEYKQITNEENWYIISQANIVACMQNLHSSHDILGYLIYFLLELEFDTPKNIYLNKVFSKIDKSKYTYLIELLDKLINHDDFKYLNAYTNHSKHRHIVNPIFNLGIPDIKKFGFSFDAFKYDKNNYEKRKVDEFLTNEYNREFQLIIQIENELINIIENK
ncbi:hypothetical protein [Aliarcobacter cryaerophilus]|jgi:hypothetical protein|uniref:hypothetical protein n=1 Tax=Aliarcobacter cryaerophilus TaxID=28198 RepID=UPI0021B1B890|nr:hypothetical protein [Aliarcobacter cryaerophilus]MCT7507168.1 hypothetical protein [Aliarcobacter cryaerophilus]